MDGNNSLGILLTYNVSCPWWTKIAKIYRRNWEELLKHRTLMSKSAKKACTLRDQCCRRDKLTTELGTELGTALGVVKTIDRTNIIVTKQRKTSQVLTPR